MMHKKKFLWVIPVVVALIVAITGVFAVPNAMPGAGQGDVALAAGSGESEEYCIHANQEQLSKMKRLWGEDVTVGELLKQAFLEVLEDMPQDEHLHLLEYKMPWAHMGTKEISDLDVCWGYRVRENEGWGWIWFGSGGKVICAATSDYIYNAESAKYTKGRCILFDEQGKPVFGPMAKESVEESTDGEPAVPLGQREWWFWTWAYLDDAANQPYTWTRLSQNCVIDIQEREIYERDCDPWLETFVRVYVNRPDLSWEVLDSDRSYYGGWDPPQYASWARADATFERHDGHYWHEMMLWNEARGDSSVWGHAGIIEGQEGLPPGSEFRYDTNSDEWPW